MVQKGLRHECIITQSFQVEPQRVARRALFRVFLCFFACCCPRTLQSVTCDRPSASGVQCTEANLPCSSSVLAMSAKRQATSPGPREATKLICRSIVASAFWTRSNLGGDSGLAGTNTQTMTMRLGVALGSAKRSCFKLQSCISSEDALPPDLAPRGPYLTLSSNFLTQLSHAFTMWEDAPKQQLERSHSR